VTSTPLDVHDLDPLHIVPRRSPQYLGHKLTPDPVHDPTGSADRRFPIPLLGPLGLSGDHLTPGGMTAKAKPPWSGGASNDLGLFEELAEFKTEIEKRLRRLFVQRMEFREESEAA
jgi:hypothetical protein